MLNMVTMDITLEQELPILIIARAADMTFKEFKEMNPEIRGYYLSSGPVSFHIPVDQKSRFQARLSDLYTAWQKNSPTRIHVVKPGENLIGIAKSYQMSLAELLRLNDISYKK